MIRFCDGEVDCVEYGSLTRLEMLDYFLPDHKDDMLCVYDSFNTKKYIGIITYKSFQKSINVDGAILKEYVVWNNDLWKNARKWFKQLGREGESLLPILNKEYQLMCFAYNDEDANREIRMLRELQEFPDTLQFIDLYPAIKCVKIYGFNELAYYFAMYLYSIGISVVTEGALWQEWFCGEDYLFPDYECLTIYAEGIEGKKHNWKDNLLKSVSVEFECIDKIYEANLFEGNIEDAEGGYTWLVEHIKDEKEIVIIDTGIESINAYDFLVSQGVNIVCFMSENKEMWKNKLFGKKVMPESEIKNVLTSPIFLECHAENSAWGFGEVDKYDYEGYRRNRQYILLKDYIDIYISCLPNILRGKNVILIGNLNLCYNVKRVLSKIEDCDVSYWDILEENSAKIQTTQRYSGNIKDDDICFLIEPQYICYNSELQNQIVEKKRLYWQKIQENNVINVTEYFSNREVLISIHKKDIAKYTLPCLTPGRILLNISGHMSGNDLLQFILDGHHDIMMIDDAIIKSNLFYICMQLSEEKSENILNAFWDIYGIVYQDAIIVRKKELFNEKFGELLAYKDKFTPQELFVMFHIAYAKMWGQVEISDMHNMLIYYEDRAEASHEKRIDYEEWLWDKKIKGYSINIIRNAYTRLGSFFKHLETYSKLIYPNVGSLWKYMTYENESQNPPAYWKRFGVKFETLKTIPKETLACICNELEIPWDDCLLETTCRGDIAEYPSGNGVIVGFDLKPVYNLYEEYFSDFDRFRINMIFSNIQSRFGYPYVSSRNFSKRQLQEMFLKEFRFEERLSYASDYWRKRYRKDFIRKVYTYIQKARREEILHDTGADSLWESICIL